MHDIEFAAEISTSLIAQVRNLQTLLSERDDELKTAQSEKTHLEIEAESLQQRLKTLDESENRYKEENWNLETRLQEFTSHQKDAADREKKLTQALNLSNAEKSSAQKDLDETKLSHSKLAEEHAAIIKQHDIELGTAKRNVAMVEGERDAMQRKIDDLTSQNQELAKAFSMQRGRAMEREPQSGLSDEDFETATDNVTPEHSPPPSPVKGTPRHAMLETETIKTSLHHAQRTIQSQRSQLHREKTEKLELRRIIQDLRDDLEKARGDGSGAGNARRSRNHDSKDYKKHAHLLGNFRSSRSEILDDPDWEENADGSPRAINNGSRATDRSDQFDTANEASESAFETANERDTETEDFQTGNEAMSGSDGTETETESAAKGFGRMKRPPSLPAGLARPGNRDSFHSTASTSADEDVLPEMRTPTTTQKSRFRLSRGLFSRTSKPSVEDVNMRSSPASVASTSTPQAAGQSLFAELQDLGGSDGESVDPETPSRRSMKSATPATNRIATRPVMVDTGVMTEPVRIATDVPEDKPALPVTLESVVPASGERLSAVWRDGRGLETGASRPVSTLSYSDASVQNDNDMDTKLAQFPVPPISPPRAVPATPPALGFSNISTEHVEPREEPLLPPTPPPTLRLTSLSVEHTEPRETPAPALAVSRIVSENVAPVVEPETPKPQLTMAEVVAQSVEPVASRPTTLTMSNITSETVEPVKERIEVHAGGVPRSMSGLVMSPTHLSLSSVYSQDLEPREEAEDTATLRKLRLSGIAAEQFEPIWEEEPALPAPPSLVLSSICSENVEPVQAPEMRPPLPRLVFSALKFEETMPISPRSPRRDAIFLPRDQGFQPLAAAVPQTPADKMFDSISSRGKKKDFTTMIAEDDTRQSVQNSPESAGTPESQRPFKEISTNTTGRPQRKPSAVMADHGAQTSLTSYAIDRLIKSGPSPRPIGHVRSPSITSVGSLETIGTVKVRRSQENVDSPTHSKGRMDNEAPFDASMLTRPGSAASGHSSVLDAPPLPRNHRQIIEAARSGSSHGNAPPGSMGPPLWPASATMKQRPRTPSGQRPMSPSSGRGTPTPRFARSGNTQHGVADVYTSGRLTAQSRRSSVSSFASELDTRFNMRPGDMANVGFGPNTDPRMIQAITQTMIGEFLWKYTRKTGRGEMSEKRHRRYFWVHPYTRTLYWSDKDPSIAGRSELKAKSVFIEAVRVVTDDNPMPPGLHRKSLIVISPGRAIKFTCTTGQRHETWFNALSYLLLRTSNDSQADAEEMAGAITQEDIDEFNPQVGRRLGGGNAGAAPSLSSYHSRTTRNESAAVDMSMNIPTLTPSGNHNKSGTATSKASVGTLSKITGYWKSGGPKLTGTLTSLRSRGAAAQSQQWEVYEASEVHDSAEDLRELIEQQDREADRLENVRACCDGKHDVGSLPHTGRRGRGHHAHSHPGQAVQSTPNTPMTSLRSRA